METTVETSIREEDDPEIVNRRLSNALGYHYAMASGGVRHYVGPLGDWHEGVPNFWSDHELSRRGVMLLGQARTEVALEFVSKLKGVLSEKDLLPCEGDGETLLNDERTRILMYLMAPPSIMARALFRTLGAEGNRGLDFDENGRFTS